LSPSLSQTVGHAPFKQRALLQLFRTSHGIVPEPIIGSIERSREMLSLVHVERSIDHCLDG